MKKALNKGKENSSQGWRNKYNNQPEQVLREEMEGAQDGRL
jgi:hypothetical protein